MNIFTGLVTVFSFHIAAFIVPGPNLILVIRNSMAGGLKNGLFTVLGITCGISVHIFYTLFFLTLLTEEVLLKLAYLKYLSALYLLYVALKNLKSTDIHEVNPAAMQKNIKYLNTFKDAFLIDFLNPIIGAFYFILWNSTLSSVVFRPS